MAGKKKPVKKAPVKRQPKKNFEKTVTNDTVVGLSRILNKVSTSELSVASIRSLLRLKKTLKSRIEDYSGAQELLYGGYNVEMNPQGIYDWQKHKQKSEIDEKSKELNKTPVDIYPTNQIPEEEFINAVKGLTVGEIDLLSEYLLEL